MSTSEMIVEMVGDKGKPKKERRALKTVSCFDL